METQFSLTQLEELTGVTFKTLKKRLKNVEPVRKVRNTLLYESRDAMPAIYQVDSPDAWNLNKERAKLAAAQAKKAERDIKRADIEIAKLRGQLVNIQEFEAEYSRILTAFKDKVLAIPAKVCKVVTKCNEEPQNYKTLTDACYETLSELSQE